MINKMNEYISHFQHKHASAGSSQANPLLKNVIKAIFILLATAATSTVQAQTCEYIGENGGQSISAEVSINGTSTQVTNGMWVPRFMHPEDRCGC
jgi:hypothetical protein